MHKSQLHILAEIKPLTSFYQLDGYAVQISGSKGLKLLALQCQGRWYECGENWGILGKRLSKEMNQQMEQGMVDKGMEQMTETETEQDIFKNLFLYRFTFLGLWIKEEA